MTGVTLHQYGALSALASHAWDAQEFHSAHSGDDVDDLYERGYIERVKDSGRVRTQLTGRGRTALWVRATQVHGDVIWLNLALARTIARTRIDGAVAPSTVVEFGRHDRYMVQEPPEMLLGRVGLALRLGLAG